MEVRAINKSALDDSRETVGVCSDSMFMRKVEALETHVNGITGGAINQSQLTAAGINQSG
jgi:hypothetical protein